ncbi:hypothetical protein ES703_95674 [subsurface metagenome]
MLAGDNVQIAQVFTGPKSLPFNHAAPIEFGAKGSAAKLWLIRLTWGEALDAINENYRMMFALTENPGWLLVPPTYAQIIDLPDFYARIFFGSTTVTYGFPNIATTEARLAGIIRPRRQIACFSFAMGEVVATCRVVAEVYYEPVEMSQQDQLSLDRKYGKYRRS